MENDPKFTRSPYSGSHLLRQTTPSLENVPYEKIEHLKGEKKSLPSSPKLSGHYFKENTLSPLKKTPLLSSKTQKPLYPPLKPLVPHDSNALSPLHSFRTSSTSHSTSSPISSSNSSSNTPTFNSSSTSFSSCSSSTMSASSSSDSIDQAYQSLDAAYQTIRHLERVVKETLEENQHLKQTCEETVQLLTECRETLESKQEEEVLVQLQHEQKEALILELQEALQETLIFCEQLEKEKEVLQQSLAIQDLSSHHNIEKNAIELEEVDREEKEIEKVVETKLNKQTQTVVTMIPSLSSSSSSIDLTIKKEVKDKDINEESD